MSEATQRNALRMLAVLRSRHFKRLFKPEDGRLSRDAEIVLADLREFCFGRKSTFSMDPAMAARWAGRREVWLRIVNYLNLDEAEVSKLVELEHE